MGMTDMEMDLVMAKDEIMTLQNAVRKQADMIANYRNHIASLQSIIEKQRQQMEMMRKTDGGSDG